MKIILQSKTYSGHPKEEKLISVANAKGNQTDFV